VLRYARRRRLSPRVPSVAKAADRPVVKFVRAQGSSDSYQLERAANRKLALTPTRVQFPVRSILAVILCRVAFVLEIAASRARRLGRRLRTRPAATRPAEQPPKPGRRRAWNRTRPEDEQRLLELQRHVGPSVGAGQLAALAHRVHGLKLSRETVRKILKRQPPRPPEVFPAIQRGALWSLDLTLVRSGPVPVWLLAVIDSCGSYLVALRPVLLPTSTDVTSALADVLRATPPPRRILTDCGREFMRHFSKLLAQHGIRHTRTQPYHPWTNGRVERIFRTLKSLLRDHGVAVPLAGWPDLCDQFRTFYNDHRPHQSFANRTPSEVYHGLALSPAPAYAKTAFLSGKVPWFRLRA
jgi:transposase InsO family protein